MKNRLAFALLMGVVTTGIISFALMAINVGFGAAFLGVWLRSWALAYLVVIPVILLVAPRLQALVDRRFAAAGRVAGRDLALKKLAFALLMGVVTTGIISFVLISVNLGFVAGFVGKWLRAWGLAYAAVVPAILFVAPWLQALVDRMLAGPRQP